MTTLYRLSAHERLADIAAAHGATTTQICALNPHKPTVQVPGLGAVFADMQAGEEIMVPGVGRGGFSSSPIAIKKWSDPGFDVFDPNAVATWKKMPSQIVAKTPILVNTSVSGGTATVLVRPGQALPGGCWQSSQQNDGSWTIQFTHFATLGDMMYPTGNSFTSPELPQTADFVPGLDPYRGNSKNGLVDCGLIEPGKTMANKVFLYLSVS